MTIKCLTFDLDDTLWDVYPVIMKAEKRFYDWLVSNHPTIAEHFDIETLIKHRQNYFQQFEDKQHDFTWLRKAWLHHIAQEYQCPPQFEETGFDTFWKARNEVELYDGVLEMLKYVNQRYQVVSITNGNADINQVGLGEYFHLAITAAEVGAAKPDPIIFEKALSWGNFKPHEVIHIGDDPRRDVKGAADLGMKTIWVNTHHSSWPGGPRADAEVNEISHLVDAIKSL
ncbi:MAG: HAD-IA family hydrolase [Gammaproteobacteria bacterium]|nr:HAD-IA family hydrolase [Gammaproteobacteria bacterium]